MQVLIKKKDIKKDFIVSHLKFQKDIDNSWAYEKRIALKGEM
jgi:hypothetical protein